MLWTDTVVMSFQIRQLLAAVNAFRTSLHWHDANIVNTNMFLAQSPSNLTCYSHASADSMHISIFTMYSALGPPLIEGVMQLEHMWSPLGPRLALPSSMFILVAYPVCRITRMCTKICRLVGVSWLFFSFHAHTKQASLWHIFPLQLTNAYEWQLGLYM